MLTFFYEISFFIDTTEDLSMSKKKTTEPLERSYCNVAPLVPEFLKLNPPETSAKTSSDHHSDMPKTPKPRNSHSSTSQENLMKKIVEAHTPESASSGSSKSIPSTPGGMSINTFEQLMKKNDSPIDMVSLNKSSKRPLQHSSQDTGLDFSMNKKHTPPGLGQLKQPPITLNNEPIEVSDDSDEMSQPPPPTPAKIHQPPTITESPQMPPQPTPLVTNQPNFNMDDMFVPNAGVGGSGGNSKLPPVSLESDLSSKELKKLKKQVKKTSASITSSLINPEKSEGVSKLAGGADLIPLSSTGLAYSAKNIPFNSLTANANPSFNTHNKPTDFQANSSSTSNTVFDNVTITAAIPSSTTSTNASTNIFDIQKKRSKEHKKIKKELKEGKIKKKKDKKDKSKSKERAEKYINSLQTSPSKEKLETSEPSPNVGGSSGSSVVIGEKMKDKDLIKKLKKEKKKEKLRTAMEESSNATSATQQHQSVQQISTSAQPESGGGEKKQKSSPPSINSSSGNEQESAPAPPTTTANTPSSSVASVVPKLTLKLGSTQSPTPPDDIHKNTNSSTVTATPQPSVVSPPRETQREPSPELARISPLVTRPPKQKINPGA